MIALFALASTVIILVRRASSIDGGYALAQRRESQNASDFAALAGARVIAEWVGGDTTNGTDANVQTAITNSIQANGGAPITFGSPNGPVYVKTDGTTNGFVGTIVRGRDPGGHGRRQRRLEPELDAVLPRHHRGQQLDRECRRDREGRLLARRSARGRLSGRRLPGHVRRPTRSARGTSGAPRTANRCT